MKQFFLVLIFAASSALSQSLPSPRWTSTEAGNDSVEIGWVFLRWGSPIISKFYEVDRTNFRLMTASYSSTPALTIPFTPSEVPGDGSIPVPLANFDLSGDGYNDLIIHRKYSGNPYRSGFRVVNLMSGQDVLVFDDPNFSYHYYDAGDYDNDGMNELVVWRAPYPPPPSFKYNLVVYPTQGVWTTARDGSNERPRSIKLGQNFPNPFNPSTQIQIDIPNGEMSSVEIFDVTGRTIKRIDLSGYAPGSHDIMWDGKNEKGVQAASGTYFYQLKSKDGIQTKKMLMLK